MEWGCYAWAGGVEESKFCLFLVAFPVKCISSISSRFYFRKHTFCFLPLATILESPEGHFFNNPNSNIFVAGVVPLFFFFFFSLLWSELEC
jgi:hypothetical protein